MTHEEKNGFLRIYGRGGGQDSGDGGYRSSPLSSFSSGRSDGVQEARSPTPSPDSL